MRIVQTLTYTTGDFSGAMGSVGKRTLSYANFENTSSSYAIKNLICRCFQQHGKVVSIHVHTKRLRKIITMVQKLW